MDRSDRYLVPVAWGLCRLGWSERGLTAVGLPDPERLDVATDHDGAAPPAAVLGCAALLRAYFAGVDVDFRSVVLDDSALSPLEAAIYAALREVGRGRTTTYGALAARIGRPGAARAVGVAMARNPWPVVVPCHRVLAADGGLGGFSAPGGVRTKRRLLRLEGVDPDRGMPPLPGLFDPE